ncbi:MAG: efflux RND transporter permease subunit [Candidatus Zixiibacteriota bacterium]|nr:MAG: efflux RND transporter permease subunit [candidate division Zixibacteria bacterium]
MYISNVSIKRPVFTTMLIVALIVLGLVSYRQMSVDLMPDIDFPFVIITTVYPGAGPEAVATDVTQKIEDIVNPIAGVKHIESTSSEGISLILVEFTLETKGLDAAQEVREKIATIRPDLPQDIEEPVVQRYDPESEPIMSIVMGGDRSPKELTSIADKLVKEKLESIEGVGAATIVGGSEREFQVLLDLDAMNARMLTFQDISYAVSASNFELPGGHLKQGPSEILVRTMGRFENVDDIKKVIVKSEDGKVIRLDDIATVVDTISERRSIARFDGQDAVTLEIRRQSGANTVEVADAIKEKLTEIKELLPRGVIAEIAMDNSVFIEESLHDVQVTIFFAGALAILAIFLFLANIPSTIITAIAIPTSIIATFTAMRFLDFTLNMMSLMALSLSVGLLIDDAIVVIENIYRHLDTGESRVDAAKNGTSEIGLAVMATTFSIVVVFLPVAFMSGIVGRFFYQFGMTIAVAVMVSLFVAFTLTPMLSSKFLQKEKPVKKESKNPITRILYYWNRLFKRFGDIYNTTLGWTLKHRFLTLLFAIAGFALSIALANFFLSTQFLPQSDRSELYISFETMPGSSLERTSDLAGMLENIIASHEDVVKYQLLTVGGEITPVNEGGIYVKLVDKNERDKTVFELVDIFREELSSVPGLTLGVATEAGHAGGGNLVEYSIRGPDYARIKNLAFSLEDILKQTPGAVDIENSEKEARPELQIMVDRDLAKDLGLDLMSIAGTVRNLVDGARVSRLKEGDEEYDIRVQLSTEYRKDVENLNNIYVASEKKIRGADYSVPLRQVASIYEQKAPTEVRRYDRQREIRVGSNAATGYTMGDVISYANAEMVKLNMPAGYSVTPVGEAEIQQESFAEIGMALMLAIIFIYLLLASQFESLVDPLSMGMSLLMAPVGAILALIIFDSAISLMSLIGIVFLMGLVTKNAILLIDFIKQARRRGVKRTEAILQAGAIRLRPILMTSLSMIFAMLPLAFGVGPGAEFRAPMAQAVIGGLTSSTLLTLIIVPVVYTLLDDIVLFVTGKRKKANI